jgi:hypothetical protein
VSTGGLAGFDDPFLRAMLDGGGGAGADAVGVHPYRQGGGESASDDLVLMRSTLAQAYQTAPPVWDTEWGYSSQWFGGDAGGHDPGGRALQAQRTSRELLSAWALGFPMEIYYDVRDDGVDPTNAEHNFGLVQNDYTDKPAVVAVRTLSQAAKGRAFEGFLPVGFSSLHAMLLVGPADRVVALWSDATASVTGVSVPAGGTAVDLLGAPVTLTTDGGATFVTVSESTGPVFLTYPNPKTPAGDAGDGDGGGRGGPADGGVGSSDASFSGDAAGGDGGASARGGASSGCGCALLGADPGSASPLLLLAALGAGLGRLFGRARRHPPRARRG